MGFSIFFHFSLSLPSHPIPSLFSVQAGLENKVRSGPSQFRPFVRSTHSVWFRPLLPPPKKSIDDDGRQRGVVDVVVVGWSRVGWLEGGVGASKERKGECGGREGTNGGFIHNPGQTRPASAWHGLLALHFVPEQQRTDTNTHKKGKTNQLETKSRQQNFCFPFSSSPLLPPTSNSFLIRCSLV